MGPGFESQRDHKRSLTRGFLYLWELAGINGDRFKNLTFYYFRVFNNVISPKSQVNENPDYSMPKKHLDLRKDESKANTYSKEQVLSDTSFPFRGNWK